MYWYTCTTTRKCRSLHIFTTFIDLEPHFVSLFGYEVKSESTPIIPFDFKISKKYLICSHEHQDVNYKQEKKEIYMYLKVYPGVLSEIQLLKVFGI